MKMDVLQILQAVVDVTLAFVAILAFWALWKLARFLGPSLSKRRTFVMLAGTIALGATILIWKLNAPGEDEYPSDIYIFGESSDVEAFSKVLDDLDASSKEPEVGVEVEVLIRDRHLNEIDSPFPVISFEQFVEAGIAGMGFVLLPETGGSIIQRLKVLRSATDGFDTPIQIRLLKMTLPVIRTDTCFLDDTNGATFKTILAALEYVDWFFPGSAWVLEPCDLTPTSDH